MLHGKVPGTGARLPKMPGAPALAVCAALILAATGWGTVGATGKDREAPRIGQASCAAWASHDPERVVALFTEDAFYEDVPFALAATGSAELRAFARDFFAAVPDLEIE